MINSDIRYARPVAKIRALETRLIGMAVFEKMWLADNYQSAVNVLDDKIYTHKNLDKNDFESGLNEHITEVHRLLKDIAVSGDLINAFLLKYDFFNLKILLNPVSRTKPGKQNVYGVFEPKELREMIKTGSYSRFKSVSPVLPPALEKIGREVPLERMNMYLQQLLSDVSIKTAEENGSEIIVDFLKKQIDLYNINNFYRCRNLRKNMDFLTDILLSGGNIAGEVFIKMFQDNTELRIVQYEKYFGSYNSDFEKKADDYLTECIGRSKTISFGIEPLIGYMWAKEIEVKNLRTILYGKIYNIEKQKIFAELRKPYN
ncbi:MAG: V-type ATPase subunit [Elusimicrobia bacterium]|nr:V-type ATPase subunit [Elusimicrobiota bacterium]